jgi:hypothetical protein
MSAFLLNNIGILQGLKSTFEKKKKKKKIRALNNIKNGKKPHNNERFFVSKNMWMRIIFF